MPHRIHGLISSCCHTGTGIIHHFKIHRTVELVGRSGVEPGASGTCNKGGLQPIAPHAHCSRCCTAIINASKRLNRQQATDATVLSAVKISVVACNRKGVVSHCGPSRLRRSSVLTQCPGHAMAGPLGHQMADDYCWPYSFEASIGAGKKNALQQINPLGGQYSHHDPLRMGQHDEAPSGCLQGDTEAVYFASCC